MVQTANDARAVMPVKKYDSLSDVLAAIERMAAQGHQFDLAYIDDNTCKELVNRGFKLTVFTAMVDYNYRITW